MPYSPSSLVNIYNNAINVEIFNEQLIMRGVYLQTGEINYNGTWYDQLRDEEGPATIKLLVSNIARNQLRPNTTIEFNAYVSRRVNRNGTIEVLVNFDSLIDVFNNRFSEEDYQKVGLINAKITSGFRDLDSYIKEAIYNDQKPRVVLVHGVTAIIDNDIKAQMAEAIALYDFVYLPTTISSAPTILQTLRNFEFQSNDILVLSRGGGNAADIAVFDNLELCEYLIGLNQLYLVTAIGHEVDSPLLEKLADKKFITPTAFGQYLKEHYNNSVEELEKSKAKLVDDITKQLKANYDKQILNLQEQLKASQELNAKSLADKQEAYAKQVQNLQEQIKALTELNDKTLKEKEVLAQEKINQLLTQFQKEKELYQKTATENKLNFEEQIRILNERLASQQVSANELVGEKEKLHSQTIQSLKDQIASMTKMYDEQVREAQRLQAERLENLQAQIAGLQSQQAEKEKALAQVNTMAENYRKQIELLEKQQPEPQSNSVLYVVIAVLVVLVFLLFLGIISK